MQPWTQASEGEGQTVLLSGEPGIGKSRLTRALLDGVQSEAHTQVHHQCSRFFSNSPLHQFIQQIERDAGLGYGDTPDERLTKLEALGRVIQIICPQQRGSGLRI